MDYALVTYLPSPTFLASVSKTGHLAYVLPISLLFSQLLSTQRLREP
jgi:hypothetical protein